MAAVHSSRLTLWLRQAVVRRVLLAAKPLLVMLAGIWRRALVGTTFVAITGSHGKTTAKELTAGLLRGLGPTFRTFQNQNGGFFVALNLLRVRPWHRFAVIEVAVSAPDQMRPLARLVRPDVAVVTTVLRAHTTGFSDQDQHAAEKAVLLEEVRPGGLAVLNGDDPRVAQMAERAACRTVIFGTSSAFDFYGTEATSRWPDRLEFDLHTRAGEFAHVRTQLVGSHWLPSVLAAATVAHGLGLPLREVAARLASTEPFLGRMQPMLTPSRAVILRDEIDGSADTFVAGLKVLAEARAARRLVVLSDVSDYGHVKRRRRLTRLGRECAACAEVVAFVGEFAEHGRRGAVEAGLAEERAHAFATPREAAAFLKQELREGDLLLLKGRGTDHLSRLFFAQLGEVGCWLRYCQKQMECDICWQLGLAKADARRAVVMAPSWASARGGRGGSR